MKKKGNISFYPMSLALGVVLSLAACEGTPPETEASGPGTSELRGAKDKEGGKEKAAAQCLLACNQIETCLHGGGYGGYGTGYGGYGTGYGGYGTGYGGYGTGYGGYGSGYGGYGSCGYAECGHGATSPTWCGYGGFGDGYGGYGNSPGYGGSGYGSCGPGSGPSTFDQCVAGCTALPRHARNKVVSCVLSAHSCKARMACE